MCQGKHSGNAIDIPASCKVTEGPLSNGAGLFEKTQLFRH